MNFDTFRKAMPDYAKDTKLNLSRVMAEEGMEGLTAEQAHGIAMASAYATKNHVLIKAIESKAEPLLSSVTINAAKGAASIMAMNNVYYRFVHLASDKAYQNMPANLRMNIIGNPGIEKADFELMSLAVSAINGCGMCIDAHVDQLEKTGVSKKGIQSSIRIASVINAAAQTEIIESSQ